MRRQAIDGLPVASRHGLFDINDAKESKRLEIVERFKLGPAPVRIRRNLDPVAEFDPQRRDPMQILGEVTGGDAHLEIPETAIDVGLRLRQKSLFGRNE